MMKTILDIMLYVAAALVVGGAAAFLGYYYPWQFAVGILSLLLLVMSYHLWKFVTIIMVLEKDLGDATEALREVEGSMQNIIDMKLYFDTPEVQQLVTHVMESVKMAQFSVNKMISNFTERSKQKYIMIIEEEPENVVEETPERPREGTIASVERS